MRCWHCNHKEALKSFAIVTDPMGYEHPVHKVCVEGAVEAGNKAEPEPKAGTLRARREDGTWAKANPHDSLYSTVTMVATHYYDAKNKSWRQILED